MAGWWRKAWVVLLVAGIVIALDQWTKMLVRANIPDYTSMAPFPGLEDYLLFEHVHNYGAAFGILQGLGGPLIIVAVIVSLAMLFYIRYIPAAAWFVLVLLGLQLGGALGNVIDRINQGYVTDFVRLGIPGIYYIPNFNVADNAIVFGVIGLGIYIMWSDYKKQREEKEAAAALAQPSADVNQAEAPQSKP
ncbi:MAG: signal peptidase II [Caldilineaceae bacterium]